MTREVLRQALEALTTRDVRLHESAAQAIRAELEKPEQVTEAYEKIDRFLRNNLDDADYAEFSAALDFLISPPEQPAQEPKLPEFFAELEYSTDWDVLVSVYQRQADAPPKLFYQEKMPKQLGAQPAQEPLFWYRPRSDGLYEGPIHNAQIERVRKESGGWVPLYARLAAAQPECDSQPEPHSRFAAIRTKITEAMHEAAVKVLFRASGLDGTPQRMLDAMIATQPPQPTTTRPVWVELTDEEIHDADPVPFLIADQHRIDLARAISAALREKNGGAQ